MGEQKPGVLIVDDELSIRDSLQSWFKKDGYRTASAESARQALAMLQADRWDVALIDVKMPEMDGIELQRRIHEHDAHIAVIIITAFASVETAVQALKQGAYDYVTKPIDPDELSRVVRRAIDQRRLQDENLQLRQSVEQLVTPREIVGPGPAMQRVLELVRSVADTDSTVLLRGESGTGKELVAQAIHATSRRRYFPIVPVNCGALTDSLLESELFGHEKGAFTGASHRRKGKLEMADGGTLFLDEIGTIQPRTQVDLLRALESKEFLRVGGSTPVKVDLRVICATNQDLEALVHEDRFREDLYFRINVVSIVLPPLRERREDIPPLAQHCLQRFARQLNRPFTDFEPAAMDVLVQHAWPGNVRELANAVERAMVVGKPPLVRAGDLPMIAQTRGAATGGGSLAEVERHHIEAMLEQNAWNISRTAELLQIDRVTLYNKIKKYGLRK